MRQVISLRFLLRLALAFSICAAVFYFAPRFWTTNLIRVITAPLPVFYPDYRIQTGLHADNKTIFMVVRVIGDMETGAQTQLVELTYDITTDLSTIYITPLVLFPLLLAWPGLAPRYRLKASLLMLPLALLVATADMSLSLIALLEERMQMTTLGFTLRHFLFEALFRGGRQVVGLVLLAIALVPHYLQGPLWRRTTGPTDRNAPCPCGSGKKYKKCCLR